MYYFMNSPVVLTDLPNDLNGSIASTDDGRLVAVLIQNQVCFHCQKSFTLLGQYRHIPRAIETCGNLAHLAWNSQGDVLLLRTDLGFLYLLYLSISEVEQFSDDGCMRTRYAIHVRSVNSLKDLGQFSCCIPTCNKIIAGNRVGRVICLNWRGEVLINEGFDLHTIPVQSEFGINAVISRIEPTLSCQHFHWAPTLGGLLVTLTNARLLLVILPLSTLDPKQVRAVYLTHVEQSSVISVNSRFRSFAVGSSDGQITLYHLNEMSNALVTSQKFFLPDPVRHGIDRMPGGVRTLSWSPDGYCLAVAWSVSGLALWSVFGSLLYSTLLDRTEVTRFIAPLNFCWTLRGLHLWTISAFVDDPNRREREDYLNAFRERALHSCNALPQTQRQVAKNVAKMRSDLCLDGDSDQDGGFDTNGKSSYEKNRSFLMVFHLAKSALAANPTGDNHLHLLLCTSDSIFVTVRHFLHSRRSMLNVPLPPAYIRANFPLKFAAINAQGSQIIVAGSRGFALYSLSSLQWRLFGNITQEQAFEVHAGLAWWGRFVCCCAFNYAINHCEIRCYPSTEKLDNRFASVLALDSSIRPLVLDVVGNRLILFSTDSYYRSFDLNVGSRGHDVVLTPHSTYNLSSFFPYAACLARIFPFSLHTQLPTTPTSPTRGKSPIQMRNAADLEDTTLLVTYAGNLLLLPSLHTTSLTRPQNDSNESAIAGFFGLGYKKDADTRKYRDTFTPTLIASRVELLWSPTSHVPSLSPPQRHIEFIHMGDSESDDDSDTSEAILIGDSAVSPGGGTSFCTPPLLCDSIWLFCGADGVRIWLPLDSTSARKSSSGLLEQIPCSPSAEKKLQCGHFPLVQSAKASRRVMISLRLDGLSYPLVIFLDKAVLVTVQSDYLRTVRSYSDVLSDPCIQMPFYCVNFKTNLFLPHLLKDLLHKNLSDVAFDLASVYCHLPYFQHILELLLHTVLEEEATSKFPIPDPLLPQVTALIELFPHFLDVVVQCTRKTEVTWWRHLFCALGRRPKDVFEHALSLEQLDTAASCLVILQNSESQSTCKQCALLLLETAIKESQWHHVKDLMRFLKATTLSDKSTDNMLSEVDAFIERVKCRFLREGSWKSLEEIFSNIPSIPPPGTLPQNDLLESSDLHSSLLPHWLTLNREYVADVDDWPRCFQRLHADFGWFLPLGSQKEGDFAGGKKRPGVAKAVNRNEKDSIPNLEVSATSWRYNLNDEIPTFHQAHRTQRQVEKLLHHLLMVLRELKPSKTFTPAEVALFSWTLLVAILQLNKQAVLNVLSLLLNSESDVITTPNIPNAPPSILLHILNGLEALEASISINPRNNPEFFGFFAELKPGIRKLVQPLLERKSVPVVVEDATVPRLLNGSDLAFEQSSLSLSKATQEKHILMSISTQQLRSQNLLPADFESASDEHLVHPGLEEKESLLSCMVS